MENIEHLKKQVSVMINLFNGKRFSELTIKGLTLIKKFPDQAIFYNLIALAYNAEGNGDEAKKILIKILKKQPENISVLNNLGLACIEVGDDNKAEEYFNRALKIKPDFPDALVNFGNLKLRQNKG